MGRQKKGDFRNGSNYGVGECIVLNEDIFTVVIIMEKKWRQTKKKLYY